MMTTWDELRLNQYITNKVEESSQLEYKSSGALSKSDKRKEDIAKDVSAMANADGGLIIYGVSEKRHLPIRISWINRSQITREWLEEVTRANISPPIQGITIHCIVAANAPTKGAYVVEIPESHTAHQASDYRYYRRHNFQCVPMDDTDVRRVMYRGVAKIIERKISDGLGLLYGFFVMLAHAAKLEDKEIEVMSPQIGDSPDRNEVEDVANKIACAIHDRPLFDPRGGTLHSQSRDKGIIQVLGGSGSKKKEVSQLPPSFILLEGIKQAVAVCGTTLATYGPSMGLDLVVRVDRFYEHLCSAQQVVAAICSNKEALEQSEGRVTDRVFLSHIRLLVGYLSDFYRPGSNQSQSGILFGETEVDMRG